MFTALLIFLGLTGGVLISRYWREVVAHLRNIAKAVKELAKLTLTSSKIVLREVVTGTVEVVHIFFYRENDGTFTNTTTYIRGIPEAELPEWARAELRAKHGMADITQQSREMLELTL